MNPKHAEFQNCVGQHDQMRKVRPSGEEGQGTLTLTITPAESAEVRLDESSGKS